MDRTKPEGESWLLCFGGNVEDRLMLDGPICVACEVIEEDWHRSTTLS